VRLFSLVLFAIAVAGTDVAAGCCCCCVLLLLFGGAWNNIFIIAAPQKYAKQVSDMRMYPKTKR